MIIWMCKKKKWLVAALRHIVHKFYIILQGFLNFSHLSFIKEVMSMFNTVQLPVLHSFFHGSFLNF